MNPKDTPNLIDAHQAVIAQIDNEMIFNKESVANFKEIESIVTFQEKGVVIATPKDFKADLGNGLKPAVNAYGHRIISFDNSPGIWVIPAPVHETFDSEMSGSVVSSNFLVTKVGRYNRGVDIVKDGAESLDTLLLLRVNNGSNNPGSTDEIGQSIQFAVQRDSINDSLSFFRYIEEPKTTEAVVVQQVVRKDPTEETGEAVDARLETPGSTLIKKHFKKLDDSIPEEANLINELRLELKKAADAKRAQS